jgi:hypothetical protein
MAHIKTSKLIYFILTLPHWQSMSVSLKGDVITVLGECKSCKVGVVIVVVVIEVGGIVVVGSFQKLSIKFKKLHDSVEKVEGVEKVRSRRSSQ